MYKRKIDRALKRWRINICWMAGRRIGEGNECMSASNYCSITPETINLKSWFWHAEKTNCSYQKEGARKSVLCSKDVLYQVTSTSSLGKTTHIFRNLLYPTNFPSWDAEDRSGVLPPPCPQAHLVIEAFFEDGRTNKLNYFCYATTNGEKAPSSRWTII